MASVYHGGNACAGITNEQSGGTKREELSLSIVEALLNTISPYQPSLIIKLSIDEAPQTGEAGQPCSKTSIAW